MALEAEERLIENAVSLVVQRLWVDIENSMGCC
jgi:hypothetical protein